MKETKANLNRKISISSLILNILKKWRILAFAVLLYFAYTAVRQTSLNNANIQIINDCKENIAVLNEKTDAMEHDLLMLHDSMNNNSDSAMKGVYVASKQILFPSNNDAKNKKDVSDFISGLSADDLDVEWESFGLSPDFKNRDLLRYFVDFEKKENSIILYCMSTSQENADVVLSMVSSKIIDCFYRTVDIEVNPDNPFILGENKYYTEKESEVFRIVFSKGIENFENKKAETESKKQEYIEVLNENETNILDWLLWTTEIGIKLFVAVFVCCLLYVAITDIVLSTDEFSKNYNQYDDVIDLKQIKQGKTRENYSGNKEKKLYVYEVGFDLSQLRKKDECFVFVNMDDLDESSCDGIEKCYLCIRKNKTSYAKIDGIISLLNKNGVLLSKVIIQ